METTGEADQNLERRVKEVVTDVLRDLKRMRLSPAQLRHLGLRPDWSKRVSPEFVRLVVQAAEKHKAALRELSKS